MESREKKGRSRKKAPASSPRDAVGGTLPPIPSGTPPPWSSPAAAPSKQPPPYASWWPELGDGIQGNQSTSVNQWGSYFNLLQQPHYPVGENSHLVGVANNINPPSPAPTPPARVTIDIDDGVEANRGVKKRFWSHDEEVRLASAWLNTSKDPIHGNDKKMDSFWGQIAEKFNKDSEPDRIRDTNQLKVHWSQLSTRINEFNGYWSLVCKMNKSGYSDDQLMDEAQKMFTKKYKKSFTHIQWWRILKNEPKWCTSVSLTDKDKGKTIEIDDRCEPRPIGREAAKAERKGKRKAEELMDDIVILGDNINKIVEVAEMNDEEKASRNKTLQWMQKKIMSTDEEA